MSCLKKEQKLMVPTKQLDVIFRRRYVQNTQFYFANRKHAVCDSITKQKPQRSYCVPRSENLLSYIKYSDRLEKLNAKHRLSQPLHKKDNLRIAATRDISQRLYLEEPPDDVRAVVEIHPEFFTVIEGRPLRSLDDIKVYTSNIRQCTMDRQQIGYRKDLIIKIEQSSVEESLQYECIAKELKEHVKNFQKFLTEDYKQSCAKVAITEKVYEKLVAKNLEFISYVSRVVLLTNILFKLEAARGILKMYRSYLTFVSPLSWRQIHDETLKGKVQSIQFESGEFVTDNDLIEVENIDSILELARNELKNPLPTEISFKRPDQMMNLFRTMELQSREYLIQLSKTGPPFRLLLERMKQLKHITKQELDYFQFYIEMINIEIKREIKNENNLQEKFFRILNELFYDSVASQNTLSLKICIEYVYEQVVGKCEEGHHTLIDPMKVLELMYEDYNLRLDSLDFQIVKQAQKDFFAQDLKILRNAYKAERELKAFALMTNNMNRVFLPPSKFKRSELKMAIDKKKKKELTRTVSKKSMDGGGNVKKKMKLTTEEQQGLLLFTDWCEGADPAPFLQEYYDFVKPAFEWMPRA